MSETVSTPDELDAPKADTYEDAVPEKPEIVIKKRLTPLPPIRHTQLEADPEDDDPDSGADKIPITVVPRHTQAPLTRSKVKAEPEKFVWNPARQVYELQGTIERQEVTAADDTNNARSTIFDIWGLNAENLPNYPTAPTTAAAPTFYPGFGSFQAQSRYNRIDDRTLSDRYHRPRCYFEQYHLEKAWRHLGKAELYREIRIPHALLVNPKDNPENEDQVTVTDRASADRAAASDRDLISYQLRTGGYITPITAEGHPGTWWGYGENEDYSQPVKAIEIYRPRDWPEGRFSLKLIFTERTWLLPCAEMVDQQEDLQPCGIELLTEEGIRIYLGYE